MAFKFKVNTFDFKLTITQPWHFGRGHTVVFSGQTPAPMWMSCGVTYLVRGQLPVSSTSGYSDTLAYDSTAIECRIPIRLSALKDRLIAARLRSLYLSSHSLEMAWMDKAEIQKQLLISFTHTWFPLSWRRSGQQKWNLLVNTELTFFWLTFCFWDKRGTFLSGEKILWLLLRGNTCASFHARTYPNNSHMSIPLSKKPTKSVK